MNDYRKNYFNPPHEESAIETSYPSEQHTGNPPTETGGDRYNSELDRVTEQEMVPDIVERITTRYDIEYNESSDRKFKIPGLNKIRVIRLIKQLFALLPRNMESGQVNNVDVIIVPIKSGDTYVSFNIENKEVTILRAYLSSSMIDIVGCLNYESSIYKFTPTIPFKQDDELIVYYK